MRHTHVFVAHTWIAVSRNAYAHACVEWTDRAKQRSFECGVASSGRKQQKWCDYTPFYSSRGVAVHPVFSAGPYAWYAIAWTVPQR